MKTIMEIVNWENMDFSNDELIAVDDVCVKYMQNPDCTEDGDEPQVIEISTRNNGVDRFINIKTENWSIDDINELVEIIKDFSKRAGLDQNEK